MISQSIRKRGINNKKKIDNIESLSENKLFPKNKHRKECLYYVSGWLLCTLRKRTYRVGEENILRQHLFFLYDNCKETDNVNLEILPTKKIDNTEINENAMCRPTKSFFLFVAYVET